MSVKILLAAINSKYIHMNPAVYSLRTYALGSGALNTENAEIAIAEYTINQPVDEILGDLYEQKPDVIGFSCYIWNWQMTKELMVEVKKLLPKTDIFLGGPEVSYEAEKIMEQYGRDDAENGNGPVIRGIILGEGEKTFCELAEYYVYERDMQKQQNQKQPPFLHPAPSYTKPMTSSSSPISTGAAAVIMRIFPASSIFAATVPSPASAQSCAPNCVRYAMPITFSTTAK